jgi:hypothetical protein
MYTLSTCDSNSCNTQLWVYTTCPSLPYTEGPMGSYVYNDDNNCGSQANMTFQLVAGTPYLIRVGDNLDACLDSIHFTFNYDGPVRGCTILSPPYRIHAFTIPIRYVKDPTCNSTPSPSLTVFH